MATHSALPPACALGGLNFLMARGLAPGDMDGPRAPRRSAARQYARMYWAAQSSLMSGPQPFSARIRPRIQCVFTASLRFEFPDIPLRRRRLELSLDLPALWLPNHPHLPPYPRHLNLLRLTRPRARRCPPRGRARLTRNKALPLTAFASPEHADELCAYASPQPILGPYDVSRSPKTWEST